VATGGRIGRRRAWCALALLLIAPTAVACSSEKGASGRTEAPVESTTAPGAGERGSVLLAARFVDAAGAGVAGLRIQVSALPSTPGLSASSAAASGTTDRDGRFTAAAVPVDVVKGASAGAPVRFLVVAFGAGAEGATWGCTFSRVARTIPDSGSVVWADPLVSLVFRPGATCSP